MRMQVCAAIGRGEARRMEGPAAHVELLLGSVDPADLFEPRNDRGDRLPDAAGVCHHLPIDRSGVTDDGLGDMGDHLDLAARSHVPPWAAIAQPNIVEHGPASMAVLQSTSMLRQS